MKLQMTIYEPNHRIKLGFFQIWVQMFKNIYRSRELIWQLFKRDFLGQYKKSFLGITWFFISPLIGILSWIFMNMVGILNPGDVGVPYPVYVLLGTSIWGMFMGFFDAGMSTLGAGSGFIMQVNYPHEALLVKQTAQFLANYILGFMITIIILLAFGVIPHWMTIFYPLLTLPLFFLGGGIGLLLSIVGIVASDVQKGFALMMSLLLFITPVVYSPKTGGPVLQSIIKWNPLTYLVAGVRDVIISGTMPHPDRYIYSAVGALVFFLLAWRLFFIAEDKIVERMI